MACCLPTLPAALAAQTLLQPLALQLFCRSPVRQQCLTHVADNCAGNMYLKSASHTLLPPVQLSSPTPRRS